MFELDQRLQRDTVDLGCFPLCRLLLMNDGRYPWFILVPQRENLLEIYQLEEVDLPQFWAESNQLSLWMEQFYNFEKLNIAALGNIVSQLHLHHVGRSINDPAWPDPVWGHSSAVPYSVTEIEKLQRAVRSELAHLLQ